jgi:N-acetylglutamate synthase-like GNAT family acetyltransferase
MAQIIRRQATEADLDLLYEIFCLVLRQYVEQTWGHWDEVAQCQRFQEVTRPEHHWILELDGNVIGCVSLKRSHAELRLLRLFILPRYQNRGFGSQILKEILASADEPQLPIRLRVLCVNPARRLYERHGFVVTEKNETHYTMVRAVCDQSFLTP